MNIMEFQLKKKITRELVTTILARKPKMCAFLEYKELKVVYKRWSPAAFKAFRQYSPCIG